MKKIDKELIKLLIKDYKELNCNLSFLSKKYNLTISTISKYIKKELNIYSFKQNIGKKYLLNENYFEVIDTEEKAYFLGFLYADGCNLTNNTSIKLGLQEQDKEILNKFSELVNSNRPLQIDKNESLLKKGKNVKTTYIFIINSKKMSDDLIKLGLFHKKTWLLKFPTEEQVPFYLLRHFIRGYFDGDGSISKVKTSKNNSCLNFNIVGNFEFINSLQSYFVNEIKLNKNKLQYRKTTQIVSLIYGGNTYICKIREHLYKDATIYLKRKFDKFFSIKEGLGNERKIKNVLTNKVYNTMKEVIEETNITRNKLHYDLKMNKGVYKYMHL